MDRSVATIVSEDEDCTIVKASAFTQTEAAIGVYGVDHAEVFLPLSQVEILEDEAADDPHWLSRKVELCVPNWLINKKRLV